MGKKKAGTGNIEIGKSLSVSNAAVIHEKILEVYKNFNSMKLDLKVVTDCDTAGIQLLYSLKKSCLDKGKKISMVNPSNAVKDALNRMAMSWDHLIKGKG